MNISKTPIRLIDLWQYNDDSNFPIIIASLKGKFKLDSVSAKVWEMINGQNTIEFIINEIAKVYNEVDKQLIHNDICDLINKFSKDNLIILNYDSLFPNINYDILNLEFNND
ncbi:MAG: PqqD family protein [Bacteroidetes bacterium]|nr:PqqD family protein [Bacteroidota bacterium]